MPDIKCIRAVVERMRIQVRRQHSNMAQRLEAEVHPNLETASYPTFRLSMTCRKSVANPL
jgi:hypothetical protein